MSPETALVHDELENRRRKLHSAMHLDPQNSRLRDLLREVDQALGRIDTGSYGLCETCHDPIERDRLFADPLLCFCIDHLSAGAQRALEQDLELASRIQAGLLPKESLVFHPWEASYHYRAAGVVSGDYCDLIPCGDGRMFFLLGDVSGKGVAAAILMSHLHAMFRTLIPLALPLAELVERAGRVFCESTLPTHYATLVCGKASTDGSVEFCNAGHWPPLLLHGGELKEVGATGLPLGMFSTGQYTSYGARLDPGDALVLFSDGMTDAEGRDGSQFGVAGLSDAVWKHRNRPAAEMVRECSTILDHFVFGGAPADDRTLLVIRRLAG
jgi:phosphoserine phosphatase RsbU/P